MYLVRYLACKMVCDYCKCTGATTLAPPGYVFVRLLLFTHWGTCHTTTFQIQEVLCKSESNYTTFNDLNPTRALFMPRGPSGPPLFKETCLCCAPKHPLGHCDSAYFPSASGLGLTPLYWTQPPAKHSELLADLAKTKAEGLHLSGVFSR